MSVRDVFRNPDLSCGLPYLETDQTLQLLRESAVDGFERALAYCADGDRNIVFRPTKGQAYAVQPKVCHPGEEFLGSLHTHPSGHSSHSLGDWNWSFQERERLACVGATFKFTTFKGDIGDIGKVLGVECFTFDTQHPDYELFRDRFMEVGAPAHSYNHALVKRLHEERRGTTDEEADEYNRHKQKIDDLVNEGQARKLIRRCNTPDNHFGRMEFPDTATVLGRPGFEKEEENCRTLKEAAQADMERAKTFAADLPTKPYLKEPACLSWRRMREEAAGFAREAGAIRSNITPGSPAWQVCDQAKLANEMLGLELTKLVADLCDAAP